jgi:Papain family cysteine protease
MKRILNRRVQFDERSRAHPVRTLTANRAPRSYTWRCPVALDQGEEGACTGFGTSHALAARRLSRPNITNESAFALYHAAQKLDEWPGEDYEGSSVIAAAKAAKAAGLCGSYKWAFGEAELCSAVSWVGPVVIGVNWYDGMYDTDNKGLLSVTGRLVGGHAIVVLGFNVRTGLYKLRNSWGRGWGIDGCCYITKADMARLLSEQGEAVVLLG